MDRRHFVRLAAAAAAGSVLERTRIASATAGSADDDLRALLDAFLNEDLDDRPQFATFWGLDTGQRAAARTKLNDYSAAGRARWIALSKTQLGRLQRIDRQKLSPNAQIDLDLTPEALELLIEKGFDPSLGARPLKRAIQKHLETPLGFLILEGKVRDGQKVLVDYDRAGQKLVFNPKKSPVAAEVGAARG